MDGDACQLPTVYQGQILDDCVRLQGKWSCVTAGGSWKECNLKDKPLPTNKNGALVVADRTTISGQQCLLPAVVRWAISMI